MGRKADGPVSALPGDLVPEASILFFDPAGHGKDLLNLIRWNDRCTRRIREDPIAREDSHPAYDHWHVGLKRRHFVTTPAGGFPTAVGREVVAGELVEVA